MERYLIRPYFTRDDSSEVERLSYTQMVVGSIPTYPILRIRAGPAEKVRMHKNLRMVHHVNQRIRVVAEVYHLTAVYLFFYI